MATLAQTSINQSGSFSVTKLALGASDTFTYTANTNQLLVLENTTGSEVTVTIDGAGSTTISPTGYGGTVSVAGGYAIAVPANSFKAVRLDSISAFLSGVIAVTGGTGVTAVLFAG